MMSILGLHLQGPSLRNQDCRYDFSSQSQCHRWILLSSILIVYFLARTMSHNASWVQTAMYKYSTERNDEKVVVLATTSDGDRQVNNSMIDTREQFHTIEAIAHNPHINTDIKTQRTKPFEPTTSDQATVKREADLAKEDKNSNEAILIKDEAHDFVLNKTSHIVNVEANDKSNKASHVLEPITGSTTMPKIKIIWLMSFPNSGTTYTNKLVQGVTQTTTATNYGQEQTGYRTTIPISDQLPNGPFYRYPEGWNRSEYVLTKTHCGAYCIRCSPQRYVLSAEQFEDECRSGNIMISGKEYWNRPAYPKELPQKAVHIIRDPFSNIVARLHMQRQNWASRDDRTEYLKWFPSDREGFRRWCRFLDHTGYDSTQKSNLLDAKTKELFPLIPCSEDFYRYVQWHNNAVEVVEQRLKLPIHTIFYENYADNFNDTVRELLEFLELPAVSTPPPFIKGKEYQDYFTEDEQHNVAHLIRHLATNQTWSLLSRYFKDVIDDDGESDPGN